MPRLPFALPHEIGLDAARLQHAYHLLESWTRSEPPAIPGAAILIGRQGKIVEPRFFGRQQPDAAAPIRRDAMFLLASITKPVVYLAALMLVERGQLSLNVPVTHYLPDFAAHHKEETLVHHLFTHTSGLPDMLDDNLALRRQHAPLSRFLEGAIRDTVPKFRAGTGLSYQSLGTAVVAELVQRLSGRSISAFLRHEIFEPLEMRSTGLGAHGLERSRIVRVQTSPDHDPSFDWNSDYWHHLGVPWGGLFSSPEDFAAICQLMLNGGRFGEVRLLAPRTVEMMTTNRLDDYPDLPEPFRRTQPWGLGWRMNHPGTKDSWSDLLDRRVYGHMGATGTLAWIDPVRQGFCLIFTAAEYARAPWRMVQLSSALAAAFV